MAETTSSSRSRARSGPAAGTGRVLRSSCSRCPTSSPERRKSPGYTGAHEAGGTATSDPAAPKGGNVVSSDLVERLPRGRPPARAEADVEIEWVEANAEELPSRTTASTACCLCSASCSLRATSGCGELAAVVRPDGLIGVSSWIPEGVNGRMFAAIGSHMPPPPDFVKPPPLWGTEDHVQGAVRRLLRARFRGAGASGSATTPSMRSPTGSATASVPWSPRRRCSATRLRGSSSRALVEVWREENLADDGAFSIEPAYLRVLARPR